MIAKAPHRTSPFDERIWFVLIHGLVGAAFGLLGWLALDFLTIPLLPGPILQSGFVMCGLRLAFWLAFRGEPTAEWRWVGALAIFFLGPLSMEILWARLPFIELPKWQLTLVAAVTISVTSGVSFRLLSGRFVRLGAALVPSGGVLYGLATLWGPLLLPFWIIVSTTVGGVWNTARCGGSMSRRQAK